MKKSVLRLTALIVLIALLLSGCSNSNDSKFNENNNKEIQLRSTNIINFDFDQFYSDIVNCLGSDNERFFIPNFDDVPPIQLQFDKNGNILWLAFYFYQLIGENETEYLVQDYSVRYGVKYGIDYRTYTHDNSTVSLAKGGIPKKLAKDPFSDIFGRLNGDQEFKQYLQWLDSFNFQEIIDTVNSSKLDFIELSNGRIKADYLKDDTINHMYMHMTAEGLVTFLPQNYEVDLSGEYTSFDGTTHCIICPYYDQDGSLVGCNELKLGQVNVKTVICNNIIVVM